MLKHINDIWVQADRGQLPNMPTINMIVALVMKAFYQVEKKEKTPPPDWTEANYAFLTESQSSPSVSNYAAPMLNASVYLAAEVAAAGTGGFDLSQVSDFFRFDEDNINSIAEDVEDILTSPARTNPRDMLVNRIVSEMTDAHSAWFVKAAPPPPDLWKSRAEVLLQDCARVRDNPLFGELLEKEGIETFGKLCAILHDCYPNPGSLYNGPEELWDFLDRKIVIMDGPNSSVHPLGLAFVVLFHRNLDEIFSTEIAYDYHGHRPRDQKKPGPASGPAPG